MYATLNSFYLACLRLLLRRAAPSCNVALSSRSSRDLVRDLVYERKGRRGRDREREDGELALVGSLDRWIVERGGRKRRRDFNALASLLVVKPSLLQPRASLRPCPSLPPSCFTYRTETSRNDVVSALPSARSAAAVPSWLPASVVPAASLSAHPTAWRCMCGHAPWPRTRTYWVRRWRDSSERRR